LASNAFGADFARALEGTGVRQVLFGIMAIVAATPGVHQGAVGRALGIKRANMVALINELVDRGMIKREASPSDRRAFELALTPEGEALLADAHARIRAHENKMLARLTAAERQTLIGLLKKIP
jgi:DNA-binding MarR family transcriptional regulator